MGNIYGYIRVSTRDQNEDRQMMAMHEMQVPEQNIEGGIIKFIHFRAEKQI